MVLAKYRLLLVSGVLALTAAGSYWGQSTAVATVAERDFLRPLKMPFRGWATTDIQPTKDELEMLQPDAVVIRRYQARNGEWAELAVIAGHQKRTVHTPGFCMAGGGWEMLSQNAVSVPVADSSAPAMRMRMMKDGNGLLATYFFTDGEYSTRNLTEFQWRQLQQRLRSEPRLGALVRIIVPVTKDPAETVKLSDEFAKTVLPPVLQKLRRVREGTTVAAR